jgi:hypothetical protein
MMIAQWVSSSRARLSLEANLLLQAVLNFLPAWERQKNFTRLCSCIIWILLKHREGTAKKK